MDGNNKNISPVDPLPPYLSGLVMYCPGVHANMFMRAMFMRAMPAM